MARLQRLESPVSTRVTAGFLSALLHLGLLLLILLSGGRRDGIHDDDTPLTRVVLFDSDIAGRRDGADTTAWQPAVSAAIPLDELELRDVEPPSQPLPEVEAPPEIVYETPPAAGVAPAEVTLTSITEPRATLVMRQAQASALLHRVERLAVKLSKKPSAHARWSMDGRRYEAELVLEPAMNGVELDRAIAEISADDRGRQYRTRIVLKRLPYSHFTKIIDWWDPMVQLHDDEIVGRTHVNSQLNLLYDAEAQPVLLGKVSTAAGGFNLRASGLRQESDVFREGVETRAKPIRLSEQVLAFEWAKRDANARTHALTSDTRITFFADGRYQWHDRKSGTSQFGSDPSGQPVYFIASRGATVYVQGIVAGKFLVYSPQRIVVEGNLVYARDPGHDPDSSDYLGLVCDKDIEVAPPRVTGPGDLRIQAALFAKRRFVVTAFEFADSATLHIYGSLAAGSLTASEPRYAMKIEYDPRFEQRRPPGFPYTKRFAAEEWDRLWTEVPARAASDAMQGQP